MLCYSLLVSEDVIIVNPAPEALLLHPTAEFYALLGCTSFTQAHRTGKWIQMGQQISKVRTTIDVPISGWTIEED